MSLFYDGVSLNTVITENLAVHGGDGKRKVFRSPFH